MISEEITEMLKSAGLKITPQRVAILQVLMDADIHPTAEIVAERLKNDFPGISLGTVYTTLETLSQKKLICKVQVDDGKLRFDAKTEMHHHLHEIDTGKIADYFDEELNNILKQYFAEKSIPGFDIKDIKLHIKGEYTNK
jgi:Fur family transcriptional regulator, peroxide stress response regulator